MRDLRGGANLKVKLTEDQVKAIYDLPGSYENLSKEFNVSESTIRDIKKERTWKHVTKESKSLGVGSPSPHSSLLLGTCDLFSQDLARQQRIGPKYAKICERLRA